VNASLGANAFVAVACPSLDECIAVDAIGDAYVGSDATPKVGPAAAGRSGARIPLSCTGPAKTACTLRLTVSVNERIVGRRIVAIGAATAPARRSVVKTVIIARATASITTGTSRIVRLTWDGAGRRLLRSHRHLRALLTVTQQVGAATVARSIQLLAP
jgi:YD repeat-containing protein